MSRSISSFSPFVALGLFSGVLLLGGQACGDRTEEPAFAATGLGSGDQPIFLNEPVVVRFNRPLAPSQPGVQEVLVRDIRGRSIPVKLKMEGSFLSIRPASPNGWPATDWLSVSIQSPPLSSPIRSLAGEPLLGGFQARVPLNLGLRRGTGPLLVVDLVGAGRSLRPGSYPDRPPDQRVKVVFNAPIDPSSLKQGCHLFDPQAKRQLAPASFKLKVSPDNERVVIIDLVPAIPPGSQGQSRGVHLFAGGGNFQIVFDRKLKAQDGRTLSRPWRSTLKAPSQPFGYIRVGFSQESDFDKDSQQFFVPGSPLRPRSREITPTYIPNQPVATEAAKLFKDEPTRIQMRIKARYLPEQGRQPFFIQSVYLFPVRGEQPGVVIPDFKASLSYLVGTGELVSTFETNRQMMRRPPNRNRDYDAASITWVPGQNGENFLKIPFQQEGLAPESAEGAGPAHFFYDGRGQDLLMSITTGGLVGPLGRHAIRVQVFHPQDLDGNLLVIGRDGEAHGLAAAILPRMVILSYHYSPVVTRWYLVPKERFKDPVFFRSANVDFEGTGWEQEDFQVEYQGGRQVDGEILPLSPEWTTRPPRGPGVQAVRLRIDPKPNSRAAGTDDLAIRSLILHFRSNQR